MGLPIRQAGAKLPATSKKPSVPKAKGGMFKKGFEGARQAAEEQEERRKMFGKKLFEFFLKNNKDEADLLFLNEEPINCEAHQVKGNRNGKEFFETVVCTGDDKCVHCASGDRPSYRGAFLVVDLREYEVTVNNKKEKRYGAVRLYLVGTKVASQLDRISQKRGLMGSVHTIVRLGSGTSTTYTFEEGQAYDPPVEEIINLLPEALKEEFGSGTEAEIDALLQEQLLIRAGVTVEGSEDDDEAIESRHNKNLVSTEDDEPPKRPVLGGGAKPKLGGGTSKPSLTPQSKARGLFPSRK